LFADNKHEQAISYFNRSLRASRRHVPALRMLLTAQAELGRIEEGKETLGKLLAEMPGLTVSAYLATGSADSTIRQRTAAAMRQLGLSED
jgi:adenylate cyclase